ncbi:MAG: glycosyltransferase family 2 protein [Desulfovibrio sp.]|jgi:dolichol-phosphate mannosyltransferase|nr:glycosyltransferase family 2 protein [Desulfovibrio sp.]
MPQYAVVIPTLNERDNILPTVERLENVLGSLDWEAIFVDDDSGDGTWQLLLSIARTKRRIRYIRRLGRRGLSSACVEGMLSTSATYIAVMDADLQHDAAILPALFAALASSDATVAVGSRYSGQGGIGQWDKTRARMSRFATALAASALLAPCTDPMSGFFAIHRRIIDKTAGDIFLSGFKILFDILTTPGVDLRVKEIPYTFNARIHGDTKLNTSVMIDFAWLLIKKICHRLPIANFAMFCFVGLSGVGVHFAALYLLLHVFAQSFVMSQSIATLCAMTSNYILNNKITFFSNELRGMSFVKGYFFFCLACTFGACVNVAIAQSLHTASFSWFSAAAAGIVAGAAINYITSKLFVWKSI